MAFTDLAKEYAGKAADKGKQIAEIAKIKSKISGLQKDIRNIKEDIADLVIKKVEAGEIDDAQVKALIDDIGVKNDDISACYEELEQAKR